MVFIKWCLKYKSIVQINNNQHQTKKKELTGLWDDPLITSPFVGVFYFLYIEFNHMSPVEVAALLNLDLFLGVKPKTWY